MPLKDLQSCAETAQNWLIEACFPLWADRGLHGCGFLEVLDLDHQPVLDPSVRVRVQARQTYMFTAAYELGWDQARALDCVKTGLDVLETVCRRADGLFGRRIDLVTGELTDDTADLYDTAFALYAFAGVYRLGTQAGLTVFAERAEALIETTLEAVDTHLADPRGGYKESLPRPDYRGQNPHMHLFEACLAVFEVTGKAAHKERAESIFNLCQTYFIDPATGTLGEYFLPADWALPEGKAGEIVEPGHQFEWVWLMSEYARLMNAPVPAAAGRLYAFACLTLDQEGRAGQSCDRAGRPVDASRRTWPQTEALKAHMAMWRAGEAEAGARAVVSFNILKEEYMTVQGGWFDHFEADGSLRAKTMPASTGYHIVLALLDLIGSVEA